MPCASRKTERHRAPNEQGVSGSDEMGRGWLQAIEVAARPGRDHDGHAEKAELAEQEKRLLGGFRSSALIGRWLTLLFLRTKSDCEPPRLAFMSTTCSRFSTVRPTLFCSRPGRAPTRLTKNAVGLMRIIGERSPGSARRNIDEERRSSTVTTRPRDVNPTLACHCHVVSARRPGCLTRRCCASAHRSMGAAAAPLRNPEGRK